MPKARTYGWMSGVLNAVLREGVALWKAPVCVCDRADRKEGQPC
jgi:hypothetical protein